MTLLCVKGVARRRERSPRTSAPLLGALSLEINGKEEARSVGEGTFEILVDDAPVAVDASSVEAARVSLEERSKEGAWGDIEQDPLGAAFLDKAPGPHVEVKLKGAALLPGDVAFILGEITAADLVEASGGMRTAPRERPSAIRAVAVASGPFAQGFIDQARALREPAAARPKEEPRSSFWAPVFGGAIFVAAVALILSLVVTSQDARAELWMLVLTVIALITRFRMEPPVFRGREAQPALSSWDLYYLVAGLGVPGSAIFFFIQAFGRADGSSRLSALVVPLLAAVLAVLPIEAAAQTSQFKRIVKTMLDARASGFKDGAWAAVEGVASDATPVQFAGDQAAIARRVATYKPPDVFTDTTFDIDTGAERVSIDPEGACWATLVTRSITIDDSKPDSRKTTKAGVEEWIPIGASVLAVGRIRRAGDALELRSTGPESLLLFAAPLGVNARDELRSLLRARRASLFVLAAFALFACASAAAFHLTR